MLDAVIRRIFCKNNDGPCMVPMVVLCGSDVHGGWRVGYMNELVRYFEQHFRKESLTTDLGLQEKQSSISALPFTFSFNITFPPRPHML